MFRANARPIGFLLCIVTLCILAIAESVDAASSPEWAKAILAAIAGEWLLERGVEKYRGRSKKDKEE